MSVLHNFFVIHKTLIIMAGAALLGLLTDFISRARDGKVKPPLWRSFLLDAPSAALMGMIAYGAGSHIGLSDEALTALVGIAGHIGGRGLYFLEQLVWETAKNKIGR